MHASPAIRQGKRLFWRVCLGSVGLVSGLLLTWGLEGRQAILVTLPVTCCMMVGQLWATSLPPVGRLLLISGPILLLMLSGLWAGGRSLGRWWRTRRLLAHSTAYCPGRWPPLDRALATLPDVQLRTLSTSQPVACTVGLRRPRVVLSAGLIVMLSPAELQSVVGHEWGHVLQRDPLRLALLRFWREFLWFLPIIRSLTQHGARVMEEGADDVAVALTQQPLDLASALVKTAKAQGQQRWTPRPALGGADTLTARVERLLMRASSRCPQRHYRAWTVSVVVTLCLFGALLLPRLTLTAIPLVPFASSPIMVCAMPLSAR